MLMLRTHRGGTKGCKAMAPQSNGEGTAPTLAALTQSSAPAVTAPPAAKLYTMNNTPYRGLWRVLGRPAA